MIVIGIDPGLTATGFGIVQKVGNTITPLQWGVIRSSTETPLADRLLGIHRQINEKIGEYCPNLFSIEEIFTGRNPRSALLVGHARGAAMLSASINTIPVREYAATVVKQAIVGNGRAAKQQVRFMVGKLLNQPVDKIAIDASDALAIAICCLLKENMPYYKRK